PSASDQDPIPGCPPLSGGRPVALPSNPHPERKSSMETKNPLTAPVLAAFGLASDTPYKPLLSGHINDTYLVQAPGRKLTLQRINHFVFPSPENIMENILGVTSF